MVLIKQQTLDVYPKAIQPINFKGNLKNNSWIFEEFVNS